MDQISPMSSKLHVGCGNNRLPGWLNYDKGVDIRRPLPFPDDSMDFVFAEHVVEHITAREAWRFLREVSCSPKMSPVCALGFRA